MGDIILSPPFQDVKVLSTEMKGALPWRRHPFTVGVGKGQIFIREEVVMLEADFLGHETPPERPPKAPGLSGRAGKPRPPALEPRTGDLDACYSHCQTAGDRTDGAHERTVRGSATGS